MKTEYDFACMHGTDFASTTVTVRPISDRAKSWFAKKYGKAAVSANYRKSAFGDFLDIADREKMTVSY